MVILEQIVVVSVNVSGYLARFFKLIGVFLFQEVVDKVVDVIAVVHYSLSGINPILHLVELIVVLLHELNLKTVISPSS